MRTPSLALCILLAVTPPVMAQVNIGIGLPGVSIGIDLGAYPELTPIPDYPVYYAPNTDANLFFFDGLYWVYSRDAWYSSAWYNGPWDALAIEQVPLFLLRVPVRYYRQAPVYFRGWRDDAPPRWGERFGPAWEGRHRDWDHWDRDSAPRLAPLPVYQRDYDRARYPRLEEQRALRQHHYDYQPREDMTRHAERPAERVATPSRPVSAQPRQRAERRPMRDERTQLAPRALVAPEQASPRATQPHASPRHDAPTRQFIKRERDVAPAPVAQQRAPLAVAHEQRNAPQAARPAVRNDAPDNRPATAPPVARARRKEDKQDKDAQDNGRGAR